VSSRSVSRGDPPACIPATIKSTTGTATSMNDAYFSASARSISAIDATVRSIDRWKRTRRPSANNATANGSISRYSSPAPARSSSRGTGPMLMMLCATECVSKR